MKPDYCFLTKPKCGKLEMDKLSSDNSALKFVKLYIMSCQDTGRAVSAEPEKKNSFFF